MKYIRKLCQDCSHSRVVRWRWPITYPTLVILLALIASSGAFGADSDEDFLRWQAEQAEALDSDDGAASAKPAEAGEDAEAPAVVVSRAAFEKLLRESFLGSYTFYEKLSDSDKADVLAHYRKTGSIVEARRLIMRRFMHR